MPLLPSQILLLNSIATQAVAPQVATPAVAGAALLLVNCEGMDEAVERQLADLKRICQGHGASDVEVLAANAQLQLRARLQAAMHPRGVSTTSAAALPSPRGPEGAGGGALTIRLGTLPSRVQAIMAAAAQGLKPLTPGAMIIGDCGVGLVRLCVGLEGIATTAIAAPLAGVLRELSESLIGYGGYVVVENAPPELKRQIEVWGPAPVSFALLKALKRKFDPEGVLSPGRFIGGL
jgi:glycolate oxidase FAD binding subunit